MLDRHDVFLDDNESIVHDKKAHVKREHDCQRVGYTINMSTDLGIASHFDLHDASLGFSVVWTIEVPGQRAKWFLSFQIYMVQNRTDITGSAAWP